MPHSKKPMSLGLYSEIKTHEDRYMQTVFKFDADWEDDVAQGKGWGKATKETAPAIVSAQKKHLNPATDD